MSTGDDMLITTVADRVRGVTWPPGYASRILRTPFVTTWHGHEDRLDRELDRVADHYQRGVRDVDLDVVTITVGEAIGLVGEREPVGAIVDGVVRQAVDLMAHKAEPG